MARSLKPATIRYLAIGGFVYIIELLVIVISQKMKAGPLVAVAWSFWIGLLTSFFLQKIITFKDKRMQRRVLLPQLFAVVMLVGFNFCFTIAMAQILKKYIPAMVIRTLALALTSIWNFYLYKTHIFKAGDTALID